MSVAADVFASDLNAARCFLSNIHEEAPSEYRAVWLGGKTRPRPAGYPKSVTFFSDQEDVLERLGELNAQGYDIFCLLSQVDTAHLEAGKPARNCDVTGTYWLGVDIDNPPSKGVLSNLGRLQESELEPTIIVQTSEPHKLQAFWQVDTRLNPDEATGINKALAKKFGGDPQSTNPARLFRVPGYLNRKEKQTAVQSQIVGGTNYGYSTTELKKWAGVEKGRQGETKSPEGGYIVSVPDRPKSVLDGLLNGEQKRLDAMRKSHARERAVDKLTSPIKRVRSANPGLPDNLAQPLRSCETLEDFVQTLMRVWPRQAGHRHLLALAISADLYRFGCTLEYALKVVQKVCKLAQDDEAPDRLSAVRDTYRKARQGKRITGAGSGAAMTVFSAEHFGPDLRTLPLSERTAERRRRVLAALESIRETDAGVKECSCRTLAERTGVCKNTVSQTLRQLEAEGVIKRVRLGVMMNKADPSHKSPEAPEANTPNIDSPTPYRAPQVQPELKKREQHGPCQEAKTAPPTARTRTYP